jgi:hypothetical protein
VREVEKCLGPVSLFECLDAVLRARMTPKLQGWSEGQRSGVAGRWSLADSIQDLLMLGFHLV